MENVVFYVIIGFVIVVSILFVLGIFILFGAAFKNLEELEKKLETLEIAKSALENLLIKKESNEHE